MMWVWMSTYMSDCSYSSQNVLSANDFLESDQLSGMENPLSQSLPLGLRPALQCGGRLYGVSFFSIHYTAIFFRLWGAHVETSVKVGHTLLVMAFWWTSWGGDPSAYRQIWSKVMMILQIKQYIILYPTMQNFGEKEVHDFTSKAKQSKEDYGFWHKNNCHEWLWDLSKNMRKAVRHSLELSHSWSENGHASIGNI